MEKSWSEYADLSTQNKNFKLKESHRKVAKWRSCNFVRCFLQFMFVCPFSSLVPKDSVFVCFTNITYVGRFTGVCVCVCILYATDKKKCRSVCVDSLKAVLV